MGVIVLGLGGLGACGLMLGGDPAAMSSSNG